MHGVSAIEYPSLPLGIIIRALDRAKSLVLMKSIVETNTLTHTIIGKLMVAAHSLAKSFVFVYACNFENLLLFNMVTFCSSC